MMHSELISVHEYDAIGKDVQNYDNVSDAVYYLIGAFMTAVMIFGFFANFVIIYTFGTNKKVRTVDNSLIIGLALSDIGQSIFGLPFVVIASFSKRWIFGGALCQYYAFVTTFLGISQIATLTIIAIERYFVIVKSDRRLTSTLCRRVLMILFPFVFGSVWASGPLLGWSKYKQEDIGIACCVTWEVQDELSLSYTLSIFTFGWFIPLFLIAYGYISIACSIYRDRSRQLQIRSQTSLNRSNRERKVAITIIIMIGAFVVSWTPYSIVSLWTAVGDVYKIPIWVIVAPAVFAKCSIIWNPIIYVARHDHFRKAIQQSMSFTNCLRFEFRTKLSFNSYFYNTSPRALVATTNMPSFKSTLDEERYLLQNRMPKINMKNRRKSFASHLVPSRESGRKCRFEKLATAETSQKEIDKTVDEHEENLPQQENATYLDEYRHFKDSITHDEYNVFDDNYEPDILSSLVQTEKLITNSRVPIVHVDKVHKDTQTSFSACVKEKSLDNKWHIDSCMRHNCTSANCSFYPSPLKEDRSTKEFDLETLKSARKLLKRQLQVLYNVQYRSLHSENTKYTDDAYIWVNNYTHKRLRDTKNPREAHPSQDLVRANLHSTTRSMNDQCGHDDITSLRMFSNQVNNFEQKTMNNTQITGLFYLRPMNRHYLSVDSKIELSSAIPHCIKQTLV